MARRIHIAIAGVGKTATYMVKTFTDLQEMLKSDVDITLLDMKEQEDPNRRKAECIAEEFRDSGRALGRDYRVSSGPANVPNPDITIITTGRQRKKGEDRRNMTWDNSIPVGGFIDYCADNGVSINYSIFGNLVNSVGGLTPLIQMKMKKAFGRKVNPRRIFSLGTGLDYLREEGSIHDYINNNPVLSRKYSSSVVDYKGVCGEHGETMVHAMDCSAIGGEPIKEVLGKDVVTNICEETRKKGALYNAQLEGAGPSVGIHAFRDLVMPIVNNSRKKVPILAPLRLDRDLTRLKLEKDRVYESVFDMVQDSKTISPEDVEEKPFNYIWTGCCPTIGRNGLEKLYIPELSYAEKRQLEYSIASTIMENLESGLLRPILDYKFKKPLPGEKLFA